MKIDGNAVWGVLLADPAFRAGDSEGQILVLEPFVKALPDILEKMLDKPVTLETLMQAKLAFLRYCLENGLIGKFAEVSREDSIFLMDKDSLRAMLERTLDEVVNMLEAMVENVSGFLEEAGVTEEQVLTSPSVGLSVGNTEQYGNGTLTIADILLTQPSIIVIVKNTD